MLLITARSMVRQLNSVLPDKADTIIVSRLLIAFAWSLKHQLRATDANADMTRLLPASTVAILKDSPLPTNRLLLMVGEHLGALNRAGKISDIVYAAIDRNLGELGRVQGASERIANTPVPYAYGLILRRTVYMFCTILPFALVDDLRYMTPFVTAFISYTFLSLEAVAEEIEEPFGTAANDLPLNALCTTIEINLLDMTDSKPLPAPLVPDAHFRLN